MALAGALHTPGAAAEVPPQRPGRRVPYLLLLPGTLWLLVFFALPIVVLFSTSLMVPVPGGEIGEYAPGLRFANYTEALAQYWPQFLRSFGYGLTATVLALAIGQPSQG